jgi:hypothetical protein
MHRVALTLRHRQLGALNLPVSVLPEKFAVLLLDIVTLTALEMQCVEHILRHPVVRNSHASEPVGLSAVRLLRPADTMAMAMRAVPRQILHPHTHHLLSAAIPRRTPAFLSHEFQGGAKAVKFLYLEKYFASLKEIL